MRVLLDPSLTVLRHFGGVQRMCTLIEQALVGAGHEVINYREVLKSRFKLEDGLLGRAAYLQLLRLHLPRYARENRIDLVHHVNYLSSMPIGGSVKSVVHIHDLRQYHGVDVQRPLLTWWRNHIISNSLKRADAVITISEWERDNIIKYLKPLLPVHILYNCVPGFWEAAGRKSGGEGIVSSLKTKTINWERLLVLPGPLIWRKQHMAFLQTFRGEIRSGQIEVCVTGSGPMLEQLQTFNQNELKGRVHFTGFLADEELIQLYKRCRLGVYFSDYEGFGLPVIEMMSQGLPVFVRRNSVFPELLCKRPEYVLSNDPKSFRHELLGIIESANFADEYRVRESDWAAYRFATFQARLLDIYKTVLDSCA